MATPLVLLLRDAVRIGVEVERRRDRSLAIRTTAATETVALAIRRREADVLRLYDWTRARVDDPAPCLLCGRSAMLRDPVDNRPCHKVCVDQLLGIGP